MAEVTKGIVRAQALPWPSGALATLGHPLCGASGISLVNQTCCFLPSLP